MFRPSAWVVQMATPTTSVPAVTGFLTFVNTYPGVKTKPHII